MGRLVGIAIKAKKRADVCQLSEVMVSLEHGVEGDHRGKPGKRQITVLSLEDWNDACRDMDQSLDWTLRRANLLVEGVRLEEQVHGRLQVGELILEITGECDPCDRLDEQIPGLQDALTPNWRGGVTCKVLTPAKIQVGDSVELFADTTAT
ncbi:MAG: MOSC domain-containing protein [Myxococcales bacterium]|nr:MOSC domain-containing protein [Myxococcales bacterium]|tara:strand:- start:558 stop:1010 length:453 start_codon:yes stop_codon:yes gene_type:complete